MGLFSNKNHFLVKGRTVLLTGGSQGAGRATARLLAEKGANVIIVARTVSKLEEALKYISDGALDKSTQRFHYISADLTSPFEASRILQEVTAWNHNTAPDIVWCVHGSAIPTLFTETPLSTLRAQMDTNYFSSAYIAHAALTSWLQPSSLLSSQPSSSSTAPAPRHLVFTSSFVAFIPLAGYAPYAPAKAALRNLADTLAMETQLYESTHLPVRVHTVFPAGIFSEGYEAENKVKAGVTKKLEEGDPTQTPEEVARLSLRSLENGDEMVTTTLITRLAMASMFGATSRNGWALLDMLISCVVVLAVPFIRMDLFGKVRAFGRDGGSGVKK